MALIKCPECSNPLSSIAKTCPHCGYNQAKADVDKNLEWSSSFTTPCWACQTKSFLLAGNCGQCGAPFPGMKECLKKGGDIAQTYGPDASKILKEWSKTIQLKGMDLKEELILKGKIFELSETIDEDVPPRESQPECGSSLLSSNSKVKKQHKTKFKVTDQNIPRKFLWNEEVSEKQIPEPKSKRLSPIITILAILAVSILYIWGLSTPPSKGPISFTEFFSRFFEDLQSFFKFNAKHFLTFFL